MKTINKHEKYSLDQLLSQEILVKFQKNYPIIKDESIRKWLEERVMVFAQKNHNPMKFNYEHNLSIMMDYCIYNEAIENPSQLLEENVDQRNDRVNEYIQALEKGWIPPRKYKHSKNVKAKSKVSIYNSHAGTIRGFYRVHGLRITTYMPNVKGTNEKEAILDRNIILGIIKKTTNPFYKLIFKMQSMLGLRISDVLDELTASHPQNPDIPKYKLEKHKDHYFIRNFETQKAKIVINFLFFPAELIQDIQKITTFEGNLIEFDFRTLFNSKWFNIYGQKIKRQNVLKQLKHFAEDLIESNVKTHCFRKYYENTIRNTNLELPPKADAEFKTHLEGHHLDPVTYTYNQTLCNITEYYDLWRKIEPRLVIEHEIKFVEYTSETVLELTKEKKKMDHQMTVMMDKLEEQEQKLRRAYEIINSMVKLDTVDVEATLRMNPQLNSKTNDDTLMDNTEMKEKKTIQLKRH